MVKDYIDKHCLLGQYKDMPLRLNSMVKGVCNLRNPRFESRVCSLCLPIQKEVTMKMKEIETLVDEDQ